MVNEWFFFRAWILCFSVPEHLKHLLFPQLLFSPFFGKKNIILYYKTATVLSTHKSCGQLSLWAKYFKHLFGDEEHHYSPNIRVLCYSAYLVWSRKQIKSHKKSLVLWDFKEKTKTQQQQKNKTKKCKRCVCTQFHFLICSPQFQPLAG